MANEMMSGMVIKIDFPKGQWYESYDGSTKGHNGQVKRKGKILEAIPPNLHRYNQKYCIAQFPSLLCHKYLASTSPEV